MKSFWELKESEAVEQQIASRNLGHRFVLMLQELLKKNEIDDEDFTEVIDMILHGKTDTEGNLPYNNVTTAFGDIIKHLRGRVSGEKFDF